MIEPFLLKRNSNNPWLPHSFCIQWIPSIFSPYVMADMIITLFYYAIPFALTYLVWQRKNVSSSCKSLAAWHTILALNVVTEGVETNAQRTCLERKGICYASRYRWRLFLLGAITEWAGLSRSGLNRKVAVAPHIIIFLGSHND